jgi:hypothetical protein
MISTEKVSVSRRVFRAASLLVALSMLAVSAPVSAEPVGKVLASSGAAQAQNTAGELRPLAQGAAVERGDTLVTGANGNVQVRFVDDALLIVRPNSRIRLDDYRAEGSKLHSVLSLIAGSIRTLTGRIGKARRDAYVMNTPTATIGVRGTDYELRLCQGDCPAGSADGLYLGVIDGVIVARNDAGAFDLKAHEYGLIRNKQTALEKLDCPPEALTGVPCDGGGTVPGTGPGAGYRAGEDREPDGFSSPRLHGAACGGTSPQGVPNPPCP